EDVEPARYGVAADPRTEPVDAARDALELGLLAAARARDVPVLGICRGFQVINVGYGGGLVQHVEGHRDANGPLVPHIAVAAPGPPVRRRVVDVALESRVRRWTVDEQDGHATLIDSLTVPADEPVAGPEQRLPLRVDHGGVMRVAVLAGNAAHLERVLRRAV